MLDKIKSLNPCVEALIWLEKYDNMELAWDECRRGDWLLWLVAKLDIDDHRRLTLAKARCAKLVIHLMKDDRSIKAVEVAERYGLGEGTKQELNVAASAAAVAAATASTAYAATYAAYAAAYADAATASTAYAATYAAYAAAVAAYADATYAAYAAERAKTLAKCADIVRDIFSYEEIVNG